MNKTAAVDLIFLVVAGIALGMATESVGIGVSAYLFALVFYKEPLK